jgi:hypothetical protein
MSSFQAQSSFKEVNDLIKMTSLLIHADEGGKFLLKNT